MAYKSFQAAKREANWEPVEFELEGERFVCVTNPTLGATADFIELSEKNALLGLIGFVESVLVDEDSVERFDALLRRNENPVDGETLSELATWLMEQFTGKSGELAPGSSTSESASGADSKPDSPPPAGPPTHSD